MLTVDWLEPQVASTGIPKMANATLWGNSEMMFKAHARLILVIRTSDNGLGSDVLCVETGSAPCAGGIVGVEEFFSCFGAFLVVVTVVDIPTTDSGTGECGRDVVVGLGLMPGTALEFKGKRVDRTARSTTGKNVGVSR